MRESSIARRPGAAALLLLPSKIGAAPEPDAIERPRVREKLAQAIARPVTTLVAPAGFSKTTALAAWADRPDGPVAWCALEEDDSDPSRFWHALTAPWPVPRSLGPRNMAEVAWTEAVEARRRLPSCLRNLGPFPTPPCWLSRTSMSSRTRRWVGDTLAIFCATCRRRSTLDAHLAHAPQGAVG